MEAGGRRLGQRTPVPCAVRLTDDEPRRALHRPRCWCGRGMLPPAVRERAEASWRTTAAHSMRLGPVRGWPLEVAPVCCATEYMPCPRASMARARVRARSVAPVRSPPCPGRARARRGCGATPRDWLEMDPEGDSRATYRSAWWHAGGVGAGRPRVGPAKARPCKTRCRRRDDGRDRRDGPVRGAVARADTGPHTQRK